MIHLLQEACECYAVQLIEERKTQTNERVQEAFLQKGYQLDELINHFVELIKNNQDV